MGPNHMERQKAPDGKIEEWMEKGQVIKACQEIAKQAAEV